MANNTVSHNRLEVKALHDLLIADFDRGLLYWKPRSAHWFSVGGLGQLANQKRWNTKFTYKQALTAIRVSDKGAASEHKYYSGSMLGRNYYAHIILYAMFHGEWPDDTVDHFDGNSLNNTISNLRPATISENGRNAVQSSANTSGVTGVFLDRRSGKWVVQIRTHELQTKHIGSFYTLEAAKRARRAAETMYGYSNRHGGSSPTVGSV